MGQLLCANCCLSTYKSQDRSIRLEEIMQYNIPKNLKHMSLLSKGIILSLNEKSKKIIFDDNGIIISKYFDYSYFTVIKENLISAFFDKQIKIFFIINYDLMPIKTYETKSKINYITCKFPYFFYGCVDGIFGLIKLKEKEKKIYFETIIIKNCESEIFWSLILSNNEIVIGMKKSISIYNLPEFIEQMNLYNLFLLNNDTKTVIDNESFEIITNDNILRRIYKFPAINEKYNFEYKLNEKYKITSLLSYKINFTLIGYKEGLIILFWDNDIKNYKEIMKINYSILQMIFINQNKFITYNDNTAIIWGIYAKENKKYPMSNIIDCDSKSN